MKPEMTLTIRDGDGNPVSLYDLQNEIRRHADQCAAIHVAYNSDSGEVTWDGETADGIMGGRGYVCEPQRPLDRCDFHFPGGCVTVTAHGFELTWRGPGSEAKP